MITKQVSLDDFYDVVQLSIFEILKLIPSEDLKLYEIKMFIEPEYFDVIDVFIQYDLNSFYLYGRDSNKVYELLIDETLYLCYDEVDFSLVKRNFEFLKQKKLILL